MMFKTYLPAIGFALAATFAAPALAQNNPGIEGYEGGQFANETAFQTAENSSALDSTGGAVGSQLAHNPSLEGYSGGGSLNPNARFDTVVTGSSQYAANPGIRGDVNAAAARETRDDFARIGDRVRYSGR